MRRVVIRRLRWMYYRVMALPPANSLDGVVVAGLAVPRSCHHRARIDCRDAGRGQPASDPLTCCSSSSPPGAPTPAHAPLGSADARLSARRRRQRGKCASAAYHLGHPWEGQPCSGLTTWMMPWRTSRSSESGDAQVVGLPRVCTCKRDRLMMAAMLPFAPRCVVNAVVRGGDVGADPPIRLCAWPGGIWF